MCLRSGKPFEHIKDKNYSGAAEPGKSLNEDSELHTRQYSQPRGPLDLVKTTSFPTCFHLYHLHEVHFLTGPFGRLLHSSNQTHNLV
jgi:hypothetical protein